MTSSKQASAEARLPSSASVFKRVLVGVDGTESGFEACRQAARLADPRTPIEAIAVVHLADAAQAGMNAPRLADELDREAEAALQEAGRILGARGRTRPVNGFVTAALLREIEDTHATLIALGSHGHRRVTEILIGGVAGELLHSAPCSVLIARPTDNAGRFPRSIVVGIDGSSAADSALKAAEQLASRFVIPLRVVAARRDKNVDLAHIRGRTPPVEEIDAQPVDALVAASRDSELIVVGSRGLHGIRALGSVSERIAHQAACSVLVVRAVPPT
jgi:nucleotide-binding universal stress UspA family protein